MDITSLEKSISAGDISPVYLFTGEDVYRKNAIADKIVKLLNIDEFNITKEEVSKADMGEIISQANTPPVFSPQRIIVLKNIEKLKKDAKEALISYMENPLQSTILILMYNDAKKYKADAAFKKAAANALTVDFAEMKGAQLSAWLNAKLKEKNLKADFDTVELLIDTIGADLHALESETEKLSVYKGEGGSITQEDVLALVGFSKEENPYALSNAVMACDKKRSLELITGMLAQGEEAISILNKITYCVQKMTRIKRLSARGLTQQEIVSGAGLMPWEGRLVQNARIFPPEAVLLRTLNRIIETDMSLKSSSYNDPALMLRGIIMTLFPR